MTVQASISSGLRISDRTKALLTGDHKLIVCRWGSPAIDAMGCARSPVVVRGGSAFRGIVPAPLKLKSTPIVAP